MTVAELRQLAGKSEADSATRAPGRRGVCDRDRWNKIRRWAGASRRVSVFGTPARSRARRRRAYKIRYDDGVDEDGSTVIRVLADDADDPELAALRDSAMTVPARTGFIRCGAKPPTRSVVRTATATRPRP